MDVGLKLIAMCTIPVGISSGSCNCKQWFLEVQQRLRSIAQSCENPRNGLQILMLVSSEARHGFTQNQIQELIAFVQSGDCSLKAVQHLDGKAVHWH